MSLFARIIRVRKGTPLWHVAPSIDVDERSGVCRQSPRSHVFRFFAWAVVVGWWQESDMTYDDSLKEFLRCGLTKPPAAWGELSGTALRGDADFTGAYSN